MTFPLVGRDIQVELYIGSMWANVSTDVHQRSPISIAPGRKNEAAQVQPATASFQLKNRSGNYSIRWPIGIYYGTLGNNTPCRISVRLVRDTFSRTVSSGWDSADTGQSYTVGGAGGVVANSDHNVGAGVGTQGVPAANAYRYGLLSVGQYKNIDVVVDCTLAVTNILTAPVEPANIMLRWQSVSIYYMIRVSIDAAEAITVAIWHADGTVLAAAVSTGLTHSSAQTLRVRGSVTGNTIRAKVWASNGSEPITWQVSAHDVRITTAGAIGIRSGVAAGNTNVFPFVFSYDNLSARDPRFFGEIAAWPSTWDVSGEDVYVSIEASGVMRRMAQSNPLPSVMLRGFTRDSTLPICYWPCEDDVNAQNSMASGIGGDPLRVVAGASAFAANTVCYSSDPLPNFGNGVWGAAIPAYSSTGQRCQVRFVLAVPSIGPGSFLRTLCVIPTTGTINRLHIFTDGTTTTGGLSITAYDINGAVLYTSGPIECGITNAATQVSVEWLTSGSDVKVALNVLVQGRTSITSITGGDHTITSQTLSVAKALIFNQDVTQASTTGVGHIAFYNTFRDLAVSANYMQFAAWDGETAGARILRLCAEEGVSFSYMGMLTDTAVMGRQSAKNLLALVQDCANADLGLLYESRSDNGLEYRTRTSLYNQTAQVVLDYALGQVGTPFQPIDDDQYITNDVTVTRDGGSSYRAVQNTGRLNVNPRPTGVGRYPKSYTLVVSTDDQCFYIAGWLLHVGIVDETRYPVIKINLANPDVVAAGLDNSVLGLELGDRVNIINPKSGQTPDTISQIVLGYVETLNRYEHSISANCVPESVYEIMVLDDAECRLDTADTTLSATMTTTATSVTVAMTSGTVWTSSDVPFTIVVTGETMTVTAVTGTVSPQTFTVTRSVNGVIKAHASGESVSLAKEAVSPL